MLPSEVPRLATDSLVRVFPGVWKLLSLFFFCNKLFFFFTFERRFYFIFLKYKFIYFNWRLITLQGSMQDTGCLGLVH